MTQEIVPTTEELAKKVWAKVINDFIEYDQSKNEAWFKNEIGEGLRSFFTEKIIPLGKIKIEIPYSEFDTFHLNDKNFIFYLCLSKVCKLIPLMDASLFFHAESDETESIFVLTIGLKK